MNSLTLFLFSIFFSSRKFGIFIFTILLLGIISALSIDYIDSIKPCILCIYQRYLVITSMIVLTPSIFYGNRQSKFFVKLTKISILLASFLIFIMILLSYYQVGIENGIFSVPQRCMNNEANNSNIEQLIISIKSINVVSRCDVPQFLLGISIAVLTSICMTIIGIFVAMYWIIRRM